jgi:hypothetical protein
MALSKISWLPIKKLLGLDECKNQYLTRMFTQTLQHCCHKLLFALFIIIALLLTRETCAVTEIGDRTCSKWNRDRTAAKQPNPSADVIWEQLVDETWLMGYLSGLAVARHSDYMKKPDYDTLNAWVDNYCAKNPGVRLGTASLGLAKELEKKMEQYEASRLLWR